MSTSSGGIERRAGRRATACHGAESAGSRAYHSSPTAISSGPATRNRRAPMPAGQRPDPGRQQRQHDARSAARRPRPPSAV